MSPLLAAATVDWAALGQETLVALLGGVGVVGAYGLVVYGLVQRADAAREGRSALAPTLLVAVAGAVCVLALVAGFVAMTTKH